MCLKELPSPALPLLTGTIDPVSHVAALHRVVESQDGVGVIVGVREAAAVVVVIVRELMAFGAPHGHCKQSWEIIWHSAQV